MKVCQRCGASNPLEFDYCGRCGSPLAIRAARPAGARSATSTGRNVVVGAAAGAVIVGSGVVLAVLLALAANRAPEIPVQSAPATNSAAPVPEPRALASQGPEAKPAPKSAAKPAAAQPTTLPAAAEPSAPKPAAAPAEPRAATPAPAPAGAELTVYVTRTGEKYHRAGCRYLRQSQIPMKLSDARRGYDACSVCDPP